MRPIKQTIALVWAALTLSCAARGALLPYTQTDGYHAIGTSVYGVLEQDLDGDGLPDVVLARKDAKGYRLNVQERKDRSGKHWNDVCRTEPVQGEEMDHLGWLGDDPEHRLAMLVVVDENPEEVIQHFVVADPRRDCNVEWADRVTIPRRETPVMRSAAAPPEGLSWVAMGNTLRLVDKAEVVGLQAEEGPVGLLARYRERLGTVEDGHLKVEETTRAVLHAKPAQVAWVQGDKSQPVPELTDGAEDTAFVVQAGQAGALTIDTTDMVVLVELHHGCDVGTPTALTLTHSGQTYVTGTAPADHAPFRAAGRRHPREESYTQELLALRDPVNHLAFDLAAVGEVRCLRDVVVYGW